MMYGTCSVSECMVCTDKFTWMWNDVRYVQCAVYLSVWCVQINVHELLQNQCCKGWNDVSWNNKNIFSPNIGTKFKIKNNKFYLVFQTSLKRNDVNLLITNQANKKNAPYIKTKNFEKESLAAEGVLLDQYYVMPTCTPSRSG